MPEITTDDVARVAKEAFYVGVGAGVLTFQKAQVKRVGLTDTVKAGTRDARERVEGLGTELEALATDLRKRLEGVVGSVDADEVVAEVVRAAREAADQVRGALRAA